MRLAGIDDLDDKRISVFKTNLLMLQQQGKGLVFVVGQAHYQKLVEAFAKDQLLEDVIFLHPYKQKCLDNSQIDYDLPVLEQSSSLASIDKPINNANDTAAFLSELEKLIQLKLNKMVLIAQTTTCQVLQQMTSLNFESYARPSHLVDAHCFFKEKPDVAEKVKQLESKGIYGFFTSVKGKPSYCVPNINMEAVASKIYKLS